MNLLQYTLLLVAGTLIAWASFFFVIVGIDPVSIGAIGVCLFYITAFASLVGTCTVVATLVRARRSPHHPIDRLVSTSFRQAFLFSSLVLLSLLLLSRNAFTLMSMILLVLGLGSIEAIYLFLLEKQESKKVE